MYRLLINEEEAELNVKARIKLNRIILELKDLSNRGVRFTNSFVIPPSGKNNRLCGNPKALSTNNNSFETSKRYTLSDNGGIVSQGKIIVRDYDEKKGIKIQLSEGVDFWSLAEGKQLNDLSLHEDDFQFNDSNMDALKVRSSSVFLTSLLDARGDKINTALVTYDYTRPCYVFRNILDNIASDLGYSIDYNDVLTTTALNLEGCMSNTRDFFVTDYKRRIKNTTYLGNIDISSWDQIVNIGNNVLPQGLSLKNTKYKTAYVIKGTVTSNFDTSILFQFSDRTERVIVPRGSSFINFKTDISDIDNLVSIRASESITFDDVYFYSIVSESEIFDVLNDISLDNMFALADYNLPIWTYKSFIKILLKQFFLNVDVDNQNRVLKLFSIGNAISTNNATDITDRTVRNNKWSTGKTYGKLNVLGYNNDNDVDLNLGRVYFSVENENSEATKAIIEISELSASNEVTVSNERIVQAPIYNTDEPKRQSVADRIVYFNEAGSFGINATFNELSFQRLYSNYYFSFIESTKRERLIEFEVFLNYNQFVTIQNNPLIYNRDLESYFLVTDISDFERDELTKLKTIKYG